MDEKEKEIITKVLKEMKPAHSLISMFLKGSIIEAVLADWIQQLESLIQEKGKNNV